MGSYIFISVLLLLVAGVALVVVVVVVVVLVVVELVVAAFAFLLFVNIVVPGALSKVPKGLGGFLEVLVALSDTDGTGLRL